jgi:hypothetical protein
LGVTGPVIAKRDKSRSPRHRLGEIVTLRDSEFNGLRGARQRDSKNAHRGVVPRFAFKGDDHGRMRTIKNVLEEMALADARRPRGRDLPEREIADAIRRSLDRAAARPPHGRESPRLPRNPRGRQEGAR